MQLCLQRFRIFVFFLYAVRVGAWGANQEGLYALQEVHKHLLRKVLEEEGQEEVGYGSDVLYRSLHDFLYMYLHVYACGDSVPRMGMRREVLDLLKIHKNDEQVTDYFVALVMRQCFGEGCEGIKLNVLLLAVVNHPYAVAECAPSGLCLGFMFDTSCFGKSFARYTKLVKAIHGTMHGKVELLVQGYARGEAHGWLPALVVMWITHYVYNSTQEVLG